MLNPHGGTPYSPTVPRRQRTFLDQQRSYGTSPNPPTPLGYFSSSSTSTSISSTIISHISITGHRGQEQEGGLMN